MFLGNTDLITSSFINLIVFNLKIETFITEFSNGYL